MKKTPGIFNDLDQIEVVRKKNVVSEEIIDSSNPDFRAQKIYIYSKKIEEAYLSLATTWRTKIALDYLNVMKTRSLLEI